MSIDSRTIKPGQVFVAIAGQRFDGHDFVRAAIERGAALVVVEEQRAGEVSLGGSVLEIRDTIEALASMASAYRRARPDLVVLGVTGSNGKTTTCRLLHGALSATWAGSCSVRSHNNHIGLPLTLLNARDGDRYVVCEMGSSSTGEIARLSAIARPDAAVITSIGRAHVEGLGDLAGVAREKSAIAQGMKTGGLMLRREEDDALDAHIGAHVRVERFGRGGGADHRIERVETREASVAFTLHGAQYEVPAPGAHNVMNGAAAAAMALHLGHAPDAIGRGLAGAELPAMRFSVQRIGGALLVNDAYNANPDSVRASISTFLEVSRGVRRRVLVLGDMLELGATSEGEHRALGVEIGAGGRIDALLTVGGAARLAGEAARAWNPMLETLALETCDDTARERVAALVRAGDGVLVKGSRAVGLERIVDAIIAQLEAAPAGASA